MLARPSSVAALSLAFLVLPSLSARAQAGGRFGGRESGRASMDRRGGQPTAMAIARALEWLKNHQHETGSWGARTYQRQCPEGQPCAGAGVDAADLQATGLAVLAFLGDGSTLAVGPYRDNVQRAVAWLRVRAERETHPRELRSPTLGRDRAIATLALVEAVCLSPDAAAQDREAARRAIERLVQDQDERGGWCVRPGEGAPDAMTTAWAIQALKTAQDLRFDVAPAVVEKAIAWLRQIGYADADAATASATLLARIFLGDTPPAHPDLRALADTALKQLPALGRDIGPSAEVWLFGSYAQFQMGSHWWNKWRQALEVATLKTQRLDGHYEGSWDPPEGEAGGRVAVTATAALCLEVYYRYTKIVR